MLVRGSLEAGIHLGVAGLVGLQEVLCTGFLRRVVERQDADRWGATVAGCRAAAQERRVRIEQLHAATVVGGASAHPVQRQVKRQKAIVALHILVRPSCQQELDRHNIAPIARMVQRRATLWCNVKSEQN